jgi:nitrogen fixation-related uncharacterized protein
MEMLFIAIVVAALAAAALLWGADSTPGVDDPEWQRRREWQGAHR